MKMVRFQTLAALAACCGMLAGPAAMAAPLAPQAATAAAAPVDVALADGGLLVGQLVDAQGAPLVEAPVALLAGGKEVVRVASNEQGMFSVQGLKGGVYEVAAPGHHGVYRLWAPRTAPPSASPGVLMVSGGQVARGQYPCNTGPFSAAMGWVSQHPILTAGIIATAVAIPLALDDDDDPAS